MAALKSLFSWGKKSGTRAKRELPPTQANFLSMLEGGSSGTGMMVSPKEDPVKGPEEGVVIDFDERSGNPMASFLDEATRLLQDSKTKGAGIDPDSLPDPPEFLNFPLFLKDRDCRAFFAKFCNETIKSPENILFFETVELFKNISDVTARRMLAKDIYHRYLMPIGRSSTFDLSQDSDRLVNVTSELRDAVRDRMPEAPPDLFHACQEEILSLMYLDALPKFLHSELKDVLKLHMHIRDTHDAHSSQKPPHKQMLRELSASSSSSPMVEEHSARTMSPALSSSTMTTPGSPQAREL
jgi:hypothetical protein